MKNLIQCDRCKKLEKMEIVKGDSDFQIKDYWRHTDIGDLCFQCWEIYSKFLKTFDKVTEGIIEKKKTGEVPNYHTTKAE